MTAKVLMGHSTLNDPLEYMLTTYAKQSFPRPEAELHVAWKLVSPQQKLGWIKDYLTALGLTTILRATGKNVYYFKKDKIV